MDIINEKADDLPHVDHDIDQEIEKSRAKYKTRKALRTEVC